MNTTPPEAAESTQPNPSPRRPREARAQAVIVCAACSLCVPRDRWPEHREKCWALERQLSLSEELAEAAFAEDLSDDVDAQIARIIEAPMVTCPFCGSRPGELCVSKEGRAMVRAHRARSELAALRTEEVDRGAIT